MVLFQVVPVLLSMLLLGIHHLQHPKDPHARHHVSDSGAKKQPPLLAAFFWFSRVGHGVVVVATAVVEGDSGGGPT